MDREQQIELVRRVLAHVGAKTTDTAPAGETLEIGAYSDDARLERETAALFRTLPLAVGHASQLPRAGDFITHDASGVPLLVIRRDDDGLDAFINVCRHRGTRVESQPSGNKRAFSCPYHGWTYGKRGQLVTIPHERGFACIDKAKRGLVRVAVGEASGFIFVKPMPLAADEDATLDARKWLGPLADDLDGFGVATSVVYGPRSVERAISWKLAIDIFLESYHLRPTHRDTIYPMFFDNLGLVDRVGPHLRNVFPKRTIKELASTHESTWQLRAHANVLFHLFPGTLVLVQPDHAAVLHVWPNGTRRATIASYLLVPEPPATDKARGYWNANAEVLYGATDEDFAMGESIQKGLASGANRDVVFGAFEHALSHFHAEIARRTRSA
jgi:phenylpropionate dioxygenase-like ring-hydroxylating dioxygenase large terminal subunit